MKVHDEAFDFSGSVTGLRYLQWLHRRTGDNAYREALLFSELRPDDRDQVDLAGIVWRRNSH